MELSDGKYVCKSFLYVLTYEVLNFTDQKFVYSSNMETFEPKLDNWVFDIVGVSSFTFEGLLIILN